MPSTSIICGILLILLGLGGYGYGMATGHASLTALIPALFGSVLGLLGRVAAMRENLRKHLMHAAVVIGLIGFIVPAVRLLSRLSELAWTAAVITQAAMAIICLVFVILAVRSFIAARTS